MSSATRMRQPVRDGSAAGMAAGSGSVRGLTGMLISNRVPSPGALSTRMVPPYPSTMRFTTARPSPTPPAVSSRTAFSCAKASNMCFWNSSLMPTPSSSQINVSRQMPSAS